MNDIIKRQKNREQFVINYNTGILKSLVCIAATNNIHNNLQNYKLN